MSKKNELLSFTPSSVLPDSEGGATLITLSFFAMAIAIAFTVIFNFHMPLMSGIYGIGLVANFIYTSFLVHNNRDVERGIALFFTAFWPACYLLLIIINIVCALFRVIMVFRYVGLLHEQMAFQIMKLGKLKRLFAKKEKPIPIVATPKQGAYRSAEERCPTCYRF